MCCTHRCSSLSVDVNLSAAMSLPFSSSPSLVLVERDVSGIATVTMNRPKSLNALNKSMLMELAKAFKALDADESVGVIILTGKGKAFSAGVDMKAADGVFKGGAADMDLESSLGYQMEKCRKPIIGAINGFCITGAFEIALACDILIASSSAIFMDTHVRWIHPSWGLSQKLSRIIGPNRAQEVSLTTMPITSRMAEKWNLVNHVVEGNELLRKSKEIAESILRNNQELVFKYKALINDGFKLDLGHGLSLEKNRAHEYHKGMTDEHFGQMQKFIAHRGSNKLSSRM